MFGENGLIALGRDCYHRVHLSSANLLTSLVEVNQASISLVVIDRDCFHRVHFSSTNLLTSEKRNQLKSEWFLID